MMVEIYRPQSAEWWLARSTKAVRDCVNALSDPPSGKVLLSFLLSGVKQSGSLLMWALQMQTITHSPNGNHLHHFFVTLKNEYPDIAKKVALEVLKEGVVISPSSGHFGSLRHLDPKVPPPKQPANRAVRNIPMGRYVDLFEKVHYDVSYRPERRGKLSEVLQLTYSGGHRVDVDIRLICDNRDPAPAHSWGYAYVGPGQLLYPLRMGRDTTPRLWQAKHDIALAGMRQSNDDFEFWVNLNMAGTFANLPAGAVVGRAAVEVPPSPRPYRAAPQQRPASVPMETPPTRPATTGGRPPTAPPESAPATAPEPVVGDRGATRPPTGALRPSERGATRPPTGYPGAPGEVVGQVPPEAAVRARELAQEARISGNDVVVNIGGAGEAHEHPHAINVNNQAVGRRGIPNLVEVDGSDIGQLFESASVDRVEGHRMPAGVIDWRRAAPGAFRILKPGGRFDYNWYAPNDDAQVCATELRAAGFRDVEVKSDVVVTARKPGVPSVPDDLLAAERSAIAPLRAYESVGARAGESYAEIWRQLEAAWAAIAAVQPGRPGRPNARRTRRQGQAQPHAP